MSVFIYCMSVYLHIKYVGTVWDLRQHPYKETDTDWGKQPQIEREEDRKCREDDRQDRMLREETLRATS